MAKERIIIDTAKDGKPFVKVKAGNNETLVISETFNSTAAARKNAAILQKRMKDAVVIDKTVKKPAKK